MNTKNCTLFLSGLLLTLTTLPLTAQTPFVKNDVENTPSYSEYFSWINNTNEGPTDAHTQVNLDFFKWLHDRYGMQLDIYAFDAGALDGAKRYGSTRSKRFKEQFPNGLDSVCNKAASIGTHLGVWCGPDGFGDTQAEADERMEIMTELVEKYKFKLFKMDGVCGQLRPEKYDYFVQMMEKIRQEDSTFILLNHRLDLGPGNRYATTYLLGGQETYIDVFMINELTAPHHRAQALARKAPDGLIRSTEDHGVCLSSCLDYWEDDLILQAFNRGLILAPQIYGNPWLLRDDEFPYFAYIYNLHRDYRTILTRGLELPAERYGEGAVSRGNGKTQFVTLRNLSWEKKIFHIKLDKEIGLTESGQTVKARQYHPYIYDLGEHAYGTEVDVEVLPFRVLLLKLTTEKEQDRIAIDGIPYHIINDRVGNVAEVKLLGKPGEKYKVKMVQGHTAFQIATIDEKTSRQLLKGQTAVVNFEGIPFAESPFRKLSDMRECAVPGDAEALYYATCFAADNNALEVRSLQRSGVTGIPQVQAARDAFFQQDIFKAREIWDQNLFDGDSTTAFSVSMRWGDMRWNGLSEFLLDMGSAQKIDLLRIESFDEYSLTPLKSYEGVNAFVSNDLVTWKQITFMAGKNMEIDLHNVGEVRYVRFSPCPIRLTEVSGYKDNKKIDSSRWRVSNLFSPYGSCKTMRAWKGDFILDEVPRGAYLCVAVNGRHGEEAAWAGLKVDGKYVGCPDRAPSFKSNTWECQVGRGGKLDKNYTYYIPLTQDMKGKKIEAYVLMLNRQGNGADSQIAVEKICPEVWLNTYPLPFESKILKLTTY